MVEKLRHSAIILLLTIAGGLFPKKISAQIQPDSLLLKAEDLAEQLFFRNHDTVYIHSYVKELAVRLIVNNKYNFFRVSDRTQNSTLRYRPDRRINLGVGVSYRWFALDLVFNLGVVEKKEFESSRFFDFQGTVFSSKHFIGATYQYYFGFKLANGSVSGKEVPESEKVREDIRTIHFNLDYLYAFDYGRFSLKAPFLLNEVQRKSAGSFLAGANFSINILDADSTMIPEDLQGDFDEKLLFTDLNASSLSINGGYMYTFVLKERFFLTLGIIPGINIIAGDYQIGAREPMSAHVFPKIKTMNAIGYNSRKFFVALQWLSDNDFYQLDKKVRVESGRGRLKLLAGYRFGREN